MPSRRPNLANVKAKLVVVEFRIANLMDDTNKPSRSAKQNLR